MDKLKSILNTEKFFEGALEYSKKLTTQSMEMEEIVRRFIPENNFKMKIYVDKIPVDDFEPLYRLKVTMPPNIEKYTKFSTKEKLVAAILYYGNYVANLGKLKGELFKMILVSNIVPEDLDFDSLDDLTDFEYAGYIYTVVMINLINEALDIMGL